MKVLIIGGAGYIGSHCTLMCLSSGHEVCVFDSLERGYLEALKNVEKIANKKIAFVQGDMRNIVDLEQVFESFIPEIVINLAGYKSVSEGEKEKEKYTENNVQGAENILKTCVKYKTKRFIFSSSAAVYGNPKYLPIDEAHPTNPISHYGKTKLQTELDMEKYSKEYGIECIALRYFNAVGSHESGEIGESPATSTNLLAVIFDTLLGNRKTTTIFGNNFNTKDGTQERDYVHVWDLASAHSLACTKNMRTPFEYYNLSTAKATSCKDLVEIAENVSGIKLNIEYGEPRQGDPEVIYADNSKAVRELLWSPTLHVEDAVKDQWFWIHKHRNGYSK